PLPCRNAMCVGKCSRIVGPCLLVLGTLSMAASILLLFPAGASKYLLEGRISSHAKAVPGVWGGGIAVSTGDTRVLPPRSGAGAEGWSRAGGFPLSSSCVFVPAGAAGSDPRHGSGVAALRLLRRRRPLQCKQGRDPGLKQESDGTLDLLHLLPSLSHRAENYLYNQRTWSICLEPEGIVTWHVVLFFLLLFLSVAEMVLALLQILNGCVGCLCGFCEGK
ncbi:T4S1 protein, partial [Sylvia borin]|nr:T4S1 protein [Sylvia borin]